MSIYYLSANGCDDNDGLTPQTAWQTVKKMNCSVYPGDTVKLRCGDSFYGGVRISNGESSEKRTVLTSYGEGKRPVISAYKIMNKGVWEKVSENIYRVDMKNADNFTGNTLPWELDANAGFMKIDGNIFYRKFATLAELNTQWDFYCDNDEKYIYVYSQRSPDELAEEIKIACDIRIIISPSHLVIDGIDFVGTGGHGVCGRGTDVIIKNCGFHEIGGSELGGYPVPNTRYGNGVEFANGSCDCYVEYCDFSGIYDVAMTLQGRVKDLPWKNIYFNNNRTWDCTQSLEIWSEGDDPEIGFENCHFENNVCLFSGDCWGYKARPDKSVATPLLIYQLHTDKVDYLIKGNLIAGSAFETIFKSGGSSEIPKSYRIVGNTIIRAEGKNLVVRTKGTGEEEYLAFENEIIKNNTVIDRIEY